MKGPRLTALQTINMLPSTACILKQYSSVNHSSYVKDRRELEKSHWMDVAGNITIIKAGHFSQDSSGGDLQISESLEDWLIAERRDK